MNPPEVQAAAEQNPSASVPMVTLRSKPAPVPPAVSKILVSTGFPELSNQSIYGDGIAPSEQQARLSRP